MLCIVVEQKLYLLERKKWIKNISFAFLSIFLMLTVIFLSISTAKFLVWYVLFSIQYVLQIFVLYKQYSEYKELIFVTKVNKINKAYYVIK